MDNPSFPEPEFDPERSKPPASRRHGSAAPPWLWLLLIGGFAIIFWQFMPKSETAVHYSPWFLDQVERDNIRSLMIKGMEIRGELRQPQPYRPGTRGSFVDVGRFITYAPSEQSIEPMIGALRDHTRAGQPVLIETRPSSGEAGFVRLILLVHSILILFLFFLLWSLRAGARR